MRQVVAQGLCVSLAGGVIGLLLTLAFARLLRGMLFGISASDPLTLAGAALIVLLVSAAASLVPGLRASRVDPMRVLREE